MTELLLSSDQREEWDAWVSRCEARDTYFQVGYYDLAEHRGEGQAQLLVYSEGRHVILLPIMLHDVTLPGLPIGWRDASSVYGYAGTLVSGGELPCGMIQRWQEWLKLRMHDQRIVALFARLHPLLVQEPVLRGLGQVEPSGTTVSVELTQSIDHQMAQYAKQLRYDIRRLIQMGATCQAENDLDLFVAVYHETMWRVGAAPTYFFDRDYFERLERITGVKNQMLTVRMNGRLLCVGWFMYCAGIIQYHLSGTPHDALQLGATKLMLHKVTELGRSWGAHTLHLGGGVGGRQDALWQFKARFSPRHHTFRTWRWVCNDNVYQDLVQRHGPPVSNFFPSYRASTEQPV